MGCEEIIVTLQVSTAENKSKGNGNISPEVEPFQTFLFSLEIFF